MKNIKVAKLDELYKNTDEALELLQKACKKQFVKLIQGELMDIETDIEALKNTINWEG